MQAKETTVWQTPTARQFSDVVTAITDQQIMQNFLRDVMTEKEIIEISARLQAAKMLHEGKKYTEIVETTKLSSRTVARISDWMKNGQGGYTTALDALYHMSPASAE